MTWYTALLPLPVTQSPSHTGIRTTWPALALTSSTIFLAQLLPLSDWTSTGKVANWIAGGFLTSSSQLFGVPSRSRIMNEPPPVFSQSTMFTGNTTGRNTPPESAPATEIASAVAVNCGRPITRPNVVVNVWVPTAWTPCAPDGMTPSPTRAAAPKVVVVVPAG